MTVGTQALAANEINLKCKNTHAVSCGYTGNHKDAASFIQSIMHNFNDHHQQPMATKGANHLSNLTQNVAAAANHFITDLSKLGR